MRFQFGKSFKVVFDGLGFELHQREQARCHRQVLMFKSGNNVNAFIGQQGNHFIRHVAGQQNGFADPGCKRFRTDDAIRDEGLQF